MKKLFLLLALLLNAVWASAQFSGSGNGTESDPYLIYNETQLYQMNNFLGTGHAGVVFKLMKDLDLTEFINDNFPSEGWLPVGVESTPFMGKFNGNNHTLSGLWISRASTDNVGLFGFIDGATISNLNIESTSIKGKMNVGTLLGYATNSVISNCTVTASGDKAVEGYNIGGIAGNITNSTEISSCEFNGVQLYSASANSYIGGIVGLVTASTLNNCKANTDINGKKHIGGICGCMEGTNSVTGCSYNGSITANTNVGGIVGILVFGSSVTFTNCHSKGSITNNGDYTGGVVGYSACGCVKNMENCSHFGDISGKNYVGGLIGCIGGTDEPIYYGSTSKTQNTKEWTSTATSIQVGSYVTNYINNCTAIGNITGLTKIGGLVGCDIAAIFTFENDGYSNSSGKMGNGNYTYLWRNNQCVYSYDSRRYYSPVDKLDYTKYNYQNCYYSGIINGTDNIGGIVGEKKMGEIRYCYTNASVYGNSNVGGIIGEASGTINDYNITINLTIKSNVAINNTISATVNNIGRIYGLANGEISIGALASAEGNRALTATKVIKQGVVQEVKDDLQNGNVMGQSLLRLKANYVALGWNFDENWDILETECFPYKKYQAAPPVIESDLISQATEIAGSSLNGGTVYLYYKSRDAVSTTCDEHSWKFTTEKLQSGAPVQLYADVEGLTPSYLTSSTVGYPGSGTEEDPYRIYTAEDLQGASNRGYYKLMNDIDLTDWINENSPTEGWVSIGRNSGEVTYINGDGHKITGLWINTSQDYTGLFSNFSAGIIKNLTVEVAKGKSVKGGDYTGVLIGRNANGKLLNCTVIGDVVGTTHVGGVTGYSGNNTVTGVTYRGNVSSKASSAFVGGIAGLSENDEISSIHSFASVSSTGNGSSVGGLIAKMNGGTLTKSHSENTVIANGSDDYVGGLVGYSSAQISLSYSTGEVKATGDNSYTGGLVGYATNKISNSYSTAKVTGTQFSAGICAYTFSSIDKCYAMGDVFGSVYGGGVVGELDGSNASLTNSIAANNKLELTAQSAWGSRVIGGFKNGASEPNNSNYALSTMQVSLNGVAQKKTDDAVEGIAKPASELMDADTYIAIGWDFGKNWGIDDDQMYPYLLWEIDINPVTEITLDNTSLIIAQGKTATLTASVMPLGATNKRLEWTTSNASVATVENGEITGVGIGNATITASSTDGSEISATCKVTVVANRDAAIAELQALVDETQKLYDNSSEGDNIGQYQSGARAALIAVIRSVKSQINSTMSDDAIIECTSQLNSAIAAFQSRRVSAGEDTDITLFENVVYVEGTEAASGSTATLSIQMNNVIAPTGFQCDIYLPDGMSFAQDEDDFYLVDLSQTRTTSKKTDYFSSAIQSDGALRIMCSSTKNYTFSGNEGEVATVQINIDKDIEEGDYPIILKNIVISDANAVTYEVEYVKSTLSVSSYTIGDANADGKINVGDFTAIAGYIMGTPPASFVEKAADVNCDDAINVGDLTGVATLILNGTLVQNNAKAYSVSPSYSSLGISDYTVRAGKEFTVDVNIDGNFAFSGYQFDVVLPHGISILHDGGLPCVALSTERTDSRQTDYFHCRMISENRLRVLCASTRDVQFAGSHGSVAHLTLVADDAAVGDYIVDVENIVLANGNKTLTPNATNFIAHASDATSISTTGDRNNRQKDLYDITGRKISTKRFVKGLYISNGNKIIK